MTSLPLASSRVGRAFTSRVHVAKELAIALTTGNSTSCVASVVCRARRAEICTVIALRDQSITTPGVAWPARTPGRAFRLKEAAVGQTDERENRQNLRDTHFLPHEIRPMSRNRVFIGRNCLRDEAESAILEKIRSVCVMFSGRSVFNENENADLRPKRFHKQGSRPVQRLGRN